MSHHPEVYEILNAIPSGLRVWRRDGKDYDRIKSSLTKEYFRLRKVNPPLSEEMILEKLKIFRTGVWEGYGTTVGLVIEDQIPENEVLGQDPDFWFEINVANSQLFSNLSLEGIEELLPGRLFTTRMPRDLKKNPAMGDNFRTKVRKYSLSTVLILTEREEYEKYAGADLEEFYRSVGVEVISRPIPDFTVPNEPDMVKNIKDVTYRLSEGLNVLVHCAGGSGRTGMVIAAVVHDVGVRAPVQWVRRVRSVYVETEAQENFVNSLPLALDERITQKHPKLALALTAQQLLDEASVGTALDNNAAVPLSDEDRVTFSEVFDLYDIDHGGKLSRDELKQVFSSLGARVDTDKAFDRIDKDHKGYIAREDFLRVMSYAMKSQALSYTAGHQSK